MSQTTMLKTRCSSLVSSQSKALKRQRRLTEMMRGRQSGHPLDMYVPLYLHLHNLHMTISIRHLLGAPACRPIPRAYPLTPSSMRMATYHHRNYHGSALSSSVSKDSGIGF